MLVGGPAEDLGRDFPRVLRPPKRRRLLRVSLHGPGVANSFLRDVGALCAAARPTVPTGLAAVKAPAPWG